MHKEMQTGRPMAGQPTAEPNHRLPERTAFFPSLRFGEERLRSFRSRRYFGSADGWPAEGRPAGGRARCTTREGRLTADFDGRREKTVSNQKRHQLSRFDRQATRRIACGENLASPVYTGPRKRWVTERGGAARGEAARGEAAQRRSRFGRAVYPVPCVGDGGGTSSTVAAVELGRAGPAARPDKPD